MEEKIRKIINKLIEQKKTVSTMESCTGGGVANAITNVERASEVLKFSAVTYSNEFKIKMGVDEKIIDRYSVYSMETAKEMSKRISDFTGSSFGIGVTGKLCRVDKENLSEENNKVYVSVYNKDDGDFRNAEINVSNEKRNENKAEVINLTMDILELILKDM